MKKLIAFAISLIMAIIIAVPSMAKTQGWGKSDAVWAGTTGEIKKPGEEITYKIQGFVPERVYRIIIAPVDGQILLGPSVAILDEDGYLLNSAITYGKVLGAYLTVGFRAEAERLQIVFSSSDNDTGNFRIKVEEGRVAPVMVVGVPTSTVLYNGTINAGQFTYYGSDVTTSWKRFVFTAVHSPNLEIHNVLLYNANTNTEIPGFVELVGGKIVFTATYEQYVAEMATEKYAVKATVFGITYYGDFLSLSLDRSSSEDVSGTFAEIAGSDASVVWSDVSESAHSVDTHDWHNEATIIGLPLFFPTLTN